MRGVVAVLAMAALAAAECPNGCSINGVCGRGDACECYDNYMGNDCSERMCPFDLAWADAPAGDLNHDGELTTKYEGGGVVSLDFTTKTNRRAYLLDDAYGYVMTQFSNKIVPEYFPIYSHATRGYIKGPDGSAVGGLKAKKHEAHFYAECSGRGACDRATGQCNCYDGFSGTACARSACPNDCSGAGICMTAQEIAIGSRVDRDGAVIRGRNYRALSHFSSYTTYDGVRDWFTYNHWDAHKSTQCVCDPGRTGPDCSMRVCPFGRDPLVRDSALCGNKACQQEVQALYLKLNIASSSNPAPAIFRLSQVDVYGADQSRKLYSHPITIDAGRTAFDYEQQLKEAVANFPNRVLFGTNISVSAFERAGAKVQTIYPQSLKLTDVGDIIEFKVDFSLGPQGNVNGMGLELVSGNTGTGGATDTFDFGSVQADSAGARASVTGAAGAKTPASGQFFTTVGDQLAPKNGNTPFVQCSGRGLCDYDAGLCDCFTGYFGPSCAEQNALAM